MVVRARHTRQSDPALAGPTTQTAVRVPEVQRQAVQDAIAGGLPGIHSFTDVVVDALWLWLYETASFRGQAHVRAAVDTQVAITEAAEAARPDPEPVVDRPRPESNGRPKWEDVDPSALDED